MRLKLLISTALCAGLLAGCDRAGTPYSAPGYTEDIMGETAQMSVEERERYAANEVSPVRAVADVPVSTFAVDVDTAAYANVRRFLTAGNLPPRDAVRSEELINYFRYDYPLPRDASTPFSVATDVSTTPWNPDTRLLRIGLRGYDIAYADRPPANLVFLIDVSGSMDEPDKLALLQSSLAMLADTLREQDRVSIVVYAGAAGLALEPTNDPATIKAALRQLSAGGSTAGGEGIELAYATARANRTARGINRVILATDGDFNVGISDQSALEDLIARNRDDGITLTVLGFGEGNLNDAMMESIADKGNGNYAYIDSAMEARKVLDQEVSSTLFTIAQDVKVQVEFNPALVSQYRLIGYENRALREEDFQNDRVDAGDIGAGHQVTAIYEIVPAGSKGWLSDRRYQPNRVGDAPVPAGDEAAFVKLRYKLPGQQQSNLIERAVPGAMLRAAAAPSGDMAFAVSVAGFAQKLRGDAMLGDWGFADIRRLAGDRQPSFWRQEFVQLVGLAESQSQTAQAQRAPTRM